MKSPVVTRQVSSHTAAPQDAPVYYDYDLPIYYNPFAFFGLIFQLIVVIVIVIGVIQAAIWGIIFLLAKSQQNKCRCPKCAKLVKLTGDENQTCPYCGSNLITKCP